MNPRPLDDLSCSLTLLYIYGIHLHLYAHLEDIQYTLLVQFCASNVCGTSRKHFKVSVIASCIILNHLYHRSQHNHITINDIFVFTIFLYFTIFISIVFYITVYSNTTSILIICFYRYR